MRLFSALFGERDVKNAGCKRRHAAGRRTKRRNNARRLGCEPLEDRMLLSIVTNGDFNNADMSQWFGVKVPNGSSQVLAPEMLTRYDWSNLTWDTPDNSRGVLQVQIANTAGYENWSHNTGVIGALSTTVPGGSILRVSFDAKSVEGATLLDVMRNNGGACVQQVELSKWWRHYDVDLPVDANTNGVLFNLASGRTNDIVPVANGTFLLDNVDVTINQSINQNTVMNSDFELNANSWYGYSGSGVLDPNVCLRTTTNTWQQTPGSLQVTSFVGSTYSAGADCVLSQSFSGGSVLRVSFYAKSISGGTVLNVARRCGASVTQQVDLTTDWDFYQIDLPVTAPTSAIAFSLVDSHWTDYPNCVAGTFLLDHVSVTQAPNAVVNGALEQDASHWSGSNATVVRDTSGTWNNSAGSLKATVAIGGGGAIGDLSKSYPAGSTLRVIFYAMNADSQGATQLTVGCPGGGAAAQQVNLTTTWKYYTVDMPVSAGTSSVLFSLAGTGAFKLDQVRVSIAPSKVILDEPRIASPYQEQHRDRLTSWFESNGFVGVRGDVMDDVVDALLAEGQAYGSVIVVPDTSTTSLFEGSVMNPRWLKFANAGGRITAAGWGLESRITPDASPSPFVPDDTARQLNLLGIVRDEANQPIGDPGTYGPNPPSGWGLENHGQYWLAGALNTQVTTPLDSYTSQGGHSCCTNFFINANPMYPWGGVVRVLGHSIDYGVDSQLRDMWRGANYYRGGLLAPIPTIPPYTPPADTSTVTIACATTAQGATADVRTQFVQGETITMTATPHVTGATSVQVALQQKLPNGTWAAYSPSTASWPYTVNAAGSWKTSSILLDAAHYANGDYKLVATPYVGSTPGAASELQIGIRYVAPQDFLFDMRVQNPGNVYRADSIAAQLQSAGLEATMGPGTLSFLDAVIGHNFGFSLDYSPTLADTLAHPEYTRLGPSGASLGPSLYGDAAHTNDSRDTSVAALIAAVQHFASIPALRPYMVTNDDWSLHYGWDYSDLVKNAFHDVYGVYPPTTMPTSVQIGNAVIDATDTAAVTWLNWMKFCAGVVDGGYNKSEVDAVKSVVSAMNVGPVSGPMQQPFVSGHILYPDVQGMGQYPTYQFGDNAFNMVSGYEYNNFWKPQLIYTYWMEVARMGSRSLPEIMMTNADSTAAYTRSSAYQILAGGVDGLEYWEDCHRSQEAWQEIVSLGATLKKIGTVQAAMTPKRASTALLTSFTTDCLLSNETGTGQSFNVYSNLQQAHFDVDMIAESEVTQTGFLNNYSTVILTGSPNEVGDNWQATTYLYLPQAVCDALKTFADNGGKVIMDMSVPTEIYGAIHDNTTNGERVQRMSNFSLATGTSSLTDPLATSVATKVDAVRNTLMPYIAQEYTASNGSAPDDPNCLRLMSNNFTIGDAPNAVQYTWFVNGLDNAEFTFANNYGGSPNKVYRPEYFNEWETAQMATPYTATVTMATLPGIPYDLTTGQAISYTHDGNGYHLSLSMPRFGGELVAFYPQAITGVTIASQQFAQPGQEFVAGATVSGTSGPIAGKVAVQFTLTDPQGHDTPFSQVIGTDNNGVASFRWTPAANDQRGNWTLTVTDLASGHTQVKTITVDALPTVSITSPMVRALLTTPTNMLIAATAADADGTVAQVAFYDGGTLLGTDTNGTDGWAYTWNNVSAGSHNLIAVATDNLGGTSHSMISTVDYSDTFTRADQGGSNPARTNAYPPSEAARAVEYAYGNAATAWSPLRWSFNIDSDVSVGGHVGGYPGNSNAGSATGFTQTGSSSPFAYGLSYDLRNDFLVQADMVTSSHWNALWIGNANDTVDSTHGLAVLFNADGSVALHNVTVGDTTVAWITTELTPLPGGNGWHNYAVNFNLDTGMLDVYLDRVFKGRIDLHTFASGDYWTKVDATTNNYVGVGGYDADRLWTDNFQVGTSAVAVLINAAPTVSLTSPANNLVFVAADTSWAIPLSATASDTDGTITAVAFYSGATKIADGVLYAGAWTATWTLPAFSFGDYTVTARVTDNLGAITASTARNLTIAGSPMNTAADVGQTATFVIARPVGAAPLASYQWQKLISGTWTNISGATGAYYTTAAVVQADNGSQYRVTATKTGGTAVTSAPATLYVNYGSELWWKLDESSGTAADSDGTGLNHIGMLLNGAAWTTDGLINGAVAFDGDDSYISGCTSNNLNYTGGEMTLSTWTYLNAGETDGATLISKRYNDTNGVNSYNYRVGINNGAAPAVFFTVTGGTDAAPSTYTVTTVGGISKTAWHHIAVTINNSAGSMRIYIDGVLTGTTATGTFPTAWNITNGNKTPVYGSKFPWTTTGHSVDTLNGRMDNVRIYNHVLSPEAIAEQARCPIAFWKFDESTGWAADSTGYGYNGTLSRGAGYLPTGGEFNGAAAFDGDDSYISVTPTTNSRPALKYTGKQMTLATWVYLNSGETDGDFISKPWNTSSGQFNYQLGLSAGKVFFKLEGTSASYTITTDATLPTGGWHHVAATVNDAGAMVIYVDGVAVKTGAHSITSWAPSDTNQPLVIGSKYAWTTTGHAAETLNGKLDNLCVYDRVLSASAIHTLAIDPPVVVSRASKRPLDLGQTTSLAIAETRFDRATWSAAAIRQLFEKTSSSAMSLDDLLGVRRFDLTVPPAAVRHVSDSPLNCVRGRDTRTAAAVSSQPSDRLRVDRVMGAFGDETYSWTDDIGVLDGLVEATLDSAFRRSQEGVSSFGRSHAVLR